MNGISFDGPRACRKDEIPEVIALVDKAMRESSDQTMLTDYPLVYQDDNLDNIRILKKDGELVSVVPFIPWEVRIEDCRFTIGIISPTATAPAHRHKGYGLACLNSCIKKMEEKHATLSVLWTRVRTFPFYEHTGYQAVRSQSWIYTCKKEDTAKFANHGHEVYTYDPQTARYIENIQRLHHGEVYGIHRSPDAYRTLFSLPKIATKIALQNGEPVAYLVVSNAVNKPGIIEGGGDECGLETLLHHSFSRLAPKTAVNLTVSLASSKLGNVLERALSGRKELNTEENTMIRINNIIALFESIQGWLVKKNKGKERRFSLLINDTNQTIGLKFSRNRLRLVQKRIDPSPSPCYELSRQELTSMVFGAHYERPMVSLPHLRELFPFYFPINILDHS